MPNTYISTQDELKAIVEQAVTKAVSERVPEIIRKATRKEWLTTQEAMKLLDCSRRHLYHLRDTNQIKYHQHGRKILFHIDEIERFLKDNEVKRREDQIWFSGNAAVQPDHTGKAGDGQPSPVPYSFPVWTNSMEDPFNGTYREKGKAYRGVYPCPPGTPVQQ